MREYTSKEHGAATLVSGISNGLGVAFGVWLSTSVRISASPVFRFRSNVKSDTRLVDECVKYAQKRGWVKHPLSIHVHSDIPPSRGMKSSSSVSLALLRCLARAGGVKLEDRELLRLSSILSVKAGVSITGAYDDALACHYGGIVFADNLKRRLLAMKKFRKSYTVLFSVPDRRIEKRHLSPHDLRSIGDEMRLVFRAAFAGRFREACTANTLLLCSVLDIEPEPALNAIAQGALLAGLSGTGPAFFALCDSKSVKRVKRSLSSYGSVVETKTRGVGDNAASI
jgi:shikimate kinase